jgi:hypothetical protein
MQCNIDGKGRSVRMISGLFVTLIGLCLVALVFAGVLAAWWWWPVAMVILALGAFQVFEAWQGWCVVRAMGIRTRI